MNINKCFCGQNREKNKIKINKNNNKTMISKLFSWMIFDYLALLTKPNKNIETVSNLNFFFNLSNGLYIPGHSRHSTRLVANYLIFSYTMNALVIGLYEFKPEKAIVVVLNFVVWIYYSITKTCLFKYVQNFTSKNWKFSDKKSLIFFLFLLKT